jgi:hypothetical protein
MLAEDLKVRSRLVVKTFFFFFFFFFFVVFNSFQPWLLEVNGDPGLHILTSVVEKHHKNAIEGLLQVVLEGRNAWKVQREKRGKVVFLKKRKKSHQQCAFDACDLTFGPWKLIYKER